MHVIEDKGAAWIFWPAHHLELNEGNLVHRSSNLAPANLFLVSVFCLKRRVKVNGGSSYDTSTMASLRSVLLISPHEANDVAEVAFIVATKVTDAEYHD
jgi:hypothetical protein